MKIGEFIENTLKPLYIQVETQELISARSAEYNFKEFSKQNIHQMMEYLTYKAFMYNIQSPQAQELRKILLEEYVLGIDQCFDPE